MVVDDGSDDPDAVAEVCRRHRARLIRAGRQRRTGRGPQPGPGRGRHRPGGLRGQRLHGHRRLARRPGLAVRRPRRRRRGPPGPARPVRADRSGHRRSPGSADAALGPGHGSGRRARWARTGRSATSPPRRWWSGGRPWPTGFDPDLRVGEDVDLVWRLLDEGWRVRYEPSVDRLPPGADLVGRRCSPVGSATARRPVRWPAPPRSAGPGRAPSWPTAAAVAVWPAGAGPPLALVVGVGRRPGPAGPPPRHPAVARPPVERGGAGWTVVGLGQAATMLAGRRWWWPPSGAGRQRRWRPLLVLAPPAVEWWRRRPDLDPRPLVVGVRRRRRGLRGRGVGRDACGHGPFGPLVPALRHQG